MRSVPRLPAALLAGLVSCLAVNMPDRAAADEGRVIQLAIQADPDMTKAQVVNKFKVARDNTKGFNFADEDISVDPIDPASFVLLSSIVRRGILEAAPVAADPRGVLVEPLRGQDGAWWIDLRDPDRFLDSAKVTAIDGESRKEQVLELKPSARSETAQPLRYHSPGSYVLKLAKGLQPRSAVLTVTTDGGAPRTEDLSIGWPDVGRCYLVTLKRVNGDEARLFESLKDPAKVGNAIKEIYPSTATLIVGTFRDLRTEVDWELNLVRLSYLVPVNARPRRLWLRFPLTEAEEATVRANLDAQLATDDGFKKLPAWLADRKLPAGDLLKPGMDKWLEIPVDPASRTFELKVPIDTGAWRKAHAESPARVGDRAILVWEFQNPAKPADREAIKVAGERYQRERFGWWLSGLPKAPLE